MYSEEIFSVPSLSVVVQDASTVYVQAVVSGVQSDLIVLEAENEKQCYLSLSGWSVCDLGQLLMFLSTVWMLWIVQAHHSIFIVGPVSLIIMIIFFIFNVSTVSDGSGDQTLQIVQLTLMSLILLTGLWVLGIGILATKR